MITYAAWHGAPFPFLWPLFWLIPLAILGFFVFRPRFHGGRAGAAWGALPRPEGARGILDERLARGEIDEEEYLRRRSVLDSL